MSSLYCRSVLRCYGVFASHLLDDDITERGEESPAFDREWVIGDGFSGRGQLMRISHATTDPRCTPSEAIHPFCTSRASPRPGKQPPSCTRAGSRLLRTPQARCNRLTSTRCSLSGGEAWSPSPRPPAASSCHTERSRSKWRSPWLPGVASQSLS